MLPHVRESGGNGGGFDGPRVVVVADEIPTRGIRLALEGDGFIVSGEGNSVERAIACAQLDPPDLCLIDLDSCEDGIEAVKTFRSLMPQTRIVVLSEFDDGLFWTLETGASGYLPKQMNPERLGPALRDALRDRAALPRDLTARLIEEFRLRAQLDIARRSRNDLTIREWEVLDCLGEGLSTSRIAKRLVITQTTVRRHVGSILRKLGVASRQAAVDLASHRSRKLNGD